MVYKRRKRIPKKMYKKKYRINTGKLLDSKINTVIERRMKEISIDEINKRKNKLIYRQYLCGAYTALTNVFAAGSPVDWTGIIMPLCQIQKTDQSTMPTVAPAANVEQTPTTYVPPGVNVIAPIYGQDGFRTGDNIYVYGISLTITIEQPRKLDDFDAGGDPQTIPAYTYSNFYISIVTSNQLGQDLIAASPTAKQALRIPIYGHSSKLDYDYDQVDGTGPREQAIKIRTIYKKKYRLPIKLGASTHIERKVYISLKKKPMKVTYDTLDQNGQQVVGPKPFIVVRSTIPAAAAYNTYKPLFRCVCKVYYTNDA